MSGEAVKVAVRVRPFNDREKQRKAKLIIDMPDGVRTIIRDPDGSGPKSFSFDHSYWSHDAFAEDERKYLKGTGSKYADQMQVFNDLGLGVLENAWKGYNCSLFAYGQTGSGKSYSMVGYGTNKGIVPIACEELFRQIDAKKGDAMEYQVTVSMMEIYMEKVRDLLDPNPPPKGGLKVREHPKKGFYVENLKLVPVSNYKAIESKIDEGTRNRTVAATNMNATSSRAHTIVQITFVQKGKNASGTSTTKSSAINLVDLAGSERHSDTGSTAGSDRMKEGIIINKSLTTLGMVIKALHDQQTAGKGGKKITVPYRDSILTSLLKNALGGNSKTVMIAALSPADINYEETLSTLRFADRAKAIKTKAVVNESATDKLIRELREENEKLMRQMKGGGVAIGGGGGGGDSEELENLRRQLEANKTEMETMEQNWQSRLNQEASDSQGTKAAHAKLEEQRKTLPHFWNLNEDPALTGMVAHIVSGGQVRVGNNKATPKADIVLTGLSIQKEHATIKNEGNKKIVLTPLPGAKLLVNGKEATSATELSHHDRVLFGGNHMYVFHHPAKASSKAEKPTYEMAQQEIAENSGLLGAVGAGGKSKEDMILEEELIHLLPQVYQANAIADELKKPVRFEIVLVAPQAKGLKSGHTEVYIKGQNKLNEHEFLWDKGNFVSRYYGMNELYQNFVEGYADWDVPKEKDPFFEPPESETLIGGVHVYLQSLAYMVELEEELPVTDWKGQERGQLSVSLTPCTPQGKELLGEFVDSPDDLVGKNLAFKVKINSAIGLPRKFATARVKYKFYLEEKEAASSFVSGANPAFHFEKKFTFKPITKQLVSYLTDSALYIEVTGTQGEARGPREIRDYNVSTSDYKAKAEKLEAKLAAIDGLLQDALSADAKTLSVKTVQKALHDDGTHNGGSSKAKPPPSPKAKPKAKAPAKKRATSKKR